MGPELVLSLDNWLPVEVCLVQFGLDRTEFDFGIPSFHWGPSTLHRLEIRGCPKLETLVGLEKLDLHQSLVIADCPLLLYILPDMKLPPRLRSLVVHGCHKLISLHLDFNSTFIELEVSDCQRLMRIGGRGI